MSATRPFSPSALDVLEQRYLRRNEVGRVVESPMQMLERVAAAVAAPARIFGEGAALWEDRFLDRMRRLEFLPNSPTLMNAGLPGGQLAACFVLPVEDDLGSIFTALGRMARIHQTGGGTGFSFSALRPRSDAVRSTGGVTSGPLSFMDLFDNATEVIREGGRRRGANMAVLRVDHPDVEEFIEAKRTPGRLSNFNLSVGMTDEFLAAVDAGARFPLRSPRTGRVARSVDARALFEATAEAAWATGDPGLLFLDEINRHNPVPALGAIEATNPCGEQPLLPYESCVLGSVNVAAFVRDERFDWDAFRDVVRDGVVFLDNVVEATSFPFPEIERVTRRTRKIGLGVMGFADLCARIGVAYDSPEGLHFGAEVAASLTAETRAASARLGEQRGSFPAFRDSVWPSHGYTAMRNATTTCIAPTGTISLLAGVSSGIEPFFALALERRLLGDRRLIEVNQTLVDCLAEPGAAREEALAWARQHGSIRRLEQLPESFRRRFPVALEIAPEMHVRMQAAFQEHVDAAVSKTVNLPAQAPVSAVRDVYRRARELRLKGITVYRYGTRAGQALSLVHEDAHRECRECAV